MEWEGRKSSRMALPNTTMASVLWQPMGKTLVSKAAGNWRNTYPYGVASTASCQFSPTTPNPNDLANPAALDDWRLSFCKTAMGNLSTVSTVHSGGYPEKIN